MTATAQDYQRWHNELAAIGDVETHWKDRMLKLLPLVEDILNRCERADIVDAARLVEQSVKGYIGMTSAKVLRQERERVEQHLPELIRLIAGQAA